MDPKQEVDISLLQRKARRAMRVAVIFLFLFAFFWSLASFFAWLFIGSAAYCLFLAWFYNSQTTPREASATPDWQRQSGGASNTQEMLKNRVRIFLPVLLGIVVIGIIAKMVISNAPDGSNPTENQDDPSDQKLSSNIDTLTNRGIEFYNQENYDSALFYYDRVLALDKGNQSALYDKALVYYSKKDYNGTLSVLRVCLSLHPDYAEAYWLLGDVHYDRSKFDSARIYFDRAYQIGLRNGSFLQLMASAYEKESPARATELYKESLNQDSSLIEGYSKLAKLDPENSAEYLRMLARWNKAH